MSGGGGPTTTAMTGGIEGIVNRPANRPLVLLLLAVAALLGACGSWKPEKVEAATAHAIDDRLSSEMTVAAFQREFPQAALVDGNETDGSWFLHVQQVCFWCRTAEGFQRSEDVYARIVRFEGGRLAGIDAVGASR